MTVTELKATSYDLIVKREGIIMDLYTVHSEIAKRMDVVAPNVVDELAVTA